MFNHYKQKVINVKYRKRKLRSGNRTSNISVVYTNYWTMTPFVSHLPLVFINFFPTWTTNVFSCRNQLKWIWEILLPEVNHDECCRNQGNKADSIPDVRHDYYSWDMLLENKGYINWTYCKDSYICISRTCIFAHLLHKQIKNSSFLSLRKHFG